MKKMKIQLIMNKKRIKTLLDFQNEFEVNEAIEYLKNEKLYKWLVSINEIDIANNVAKIIISDNIESITIELMNILTMSAEQQESIIGVFKAEKNKIKSEKEAEIKKNEAEKIEQERIIAEKEKRRLKGIAKAKIDAKNGIRFERLKS